MMMLSEELNYLMDPFEYIVKVPGKQVRSRLTMALNHWLSIDVAIVENIKIILEMLHNASLMVDDIEDMSNLRRGMPVAHNIYGLARTINTANYIYFVALSKCFQLGHPKAAEIFTHHMLELHHGQAKELYWRDTIQCPSEADYESMVIQKTGGLFFLCIRLMELFSTSKLNFERLGKHLALYFQIRDDYLNLCPKESVDEKIFADDLTEGKFSFPIIIALRNAGPDDEVLNILRRRTNKWEVKSYCVNVLRERGAITRTLVRLKELSDEIMAEINRLGGNKPLVSLLESLNIELH